MKVKIFSLFTALSIGFSSLIFPFYSVSAYAQQAVIPWPYIFRFIAESLGTYAISKGADYAVDQLTGSGRKMSDDEYNATSKDWDACVSYMKSQGCTDSDIENLQAQIQGGDLDLSSKVGQVMQNYFAQKCSNIDGAWNTFNNPNLVGFGTFISHDEAISIITSYMGCAPDVGVDINVPADTVAVLLTPSFSSGEFKNFYFYPSSKLVDGKLDISDIVSCQTIYRNYHDDTWYWSVDNHLGCYSFDPSDTSVYSAYDILHDTAVKNHDKGFLNSNASMPNRISCYGGNIPHYFDNTIDNDDSSKNTYNNSAPSIDWSKIFDQDDDKNPTFKKIHGYTPPKPKIKEDGSNYDEVIKQLQEANSKLSKILGWLEDFDYDNNGKIKDHRLSPIEPNTPLFNFKLSEKFPFSLPWDMLAILSILKAAPVAPKYEFPIMMPDESGKVKPIKLSDDRIGVIQGDKIVLDFTSQDWQDTAKILRWGELVLFICGLCVVFWKYGK